MREGARRVLFRGPNSIILPFETVRSHRFAMGVTPNVRWYLS